MSAEEAIARAKAIAARLAGTGATSATAPSAEGQAGVVAEAALAAAFGSSGESEGDASNGVSSKRKRWGAETNPSDTAVSDAVAAALSAAKRSKTGVAAEVKKKVWIPVDKNPGYNYIGLLIGPGGSKQRELVNRSGGNVKISIRGRGSSSSNVVVGQPEEPLHVLLEGNEECVKNAEQLVSELLNDSSKAQAEKEKQLSAISASKGGDIAGTQGTAATGSYQPKPVAQLLGLNGNGHYGSASEATELVEEKIGVPNGVVGFIIGKGGESITSMQRKSGCRVQIQKEFEMDAGSTQRIITLTAPNQESINMCRQIIEEMVQERLRLNQEMQNSRGMGGGTTFAPGANASAQAAQLQHAIAGGHAHVTVAVPNSDVGLIIGKGGVTIKMLQERSGANLQIPQVADSDNPLIRTINITHPQKEGAEFAKTLVEEIMAQKTNNNIYGGGGGGSTGYVPKSTDMSIQVQIPDKDVGMCIGKSGCVIREMQQRTQTKIQIPSQPTPGQPNRIATVTGSNEGCQKVQEIINRIIIEQSSQFVMTGAAFGTQQQYTSIGSQQPQGDYSAQWAAYYASAGYNVQGAVASTSATVTTTASTNDVSTTDQQKPKADAYYDAFFRYEYHYGEEAARKYYGAWSPPVGTANPYGVNPNQAATPASVSTPEASTTTTTAEQNKDAGTESKVRDSSVRNVSNLPAWMTKS